MRRPAILAGAARALTGRAPGPPCRSAVRPHSRSLLTFWPPAGGAHCAQLESSSGSRGSGNRDWPRVSRAAGSPRHEGLSISTRTSRCATGMTMPCCLNSRKMARFTSSATFVDAFLRSGIQKRSSSSCRDREGHQARHRAGFWITRGWPRVDRASAHGELGVALVAHAHRQLQAHGAGRCSSSSPPSW